MLGGRRALVGDVHCNLCLVTGGYGSPEVEQVPDKEESNYDCAAFRHELSADTINSEKVHTLASIALIQGILEPNFVTQAT